MFKTIVFGTDGSPGSQHAFAVTQSLAMSEGARVVVVHIVELVGGKGGLHPLALDEDRIEADIRDQVEALRSAGLDVELIVEHIAYGGPARAIAEQARNVEADVIIVGNRGHAAIAELLTGSVPIRLLEIAHRPILIVPPLPEDEKPTQSAHS